ncbi:MAG: TetR/AcrR family transcriptional regulator [Pseudomonadota bacterium]
MEPKKHRYHHGDLRAALLKAAEQELKARGIEQFSLRGVARAAGVSHAAPAHHFGDVTGLLTALAVVGWHRFVEAQRRQQAKAEAEPLAQLVAAAKGYAAFAKANPELFVLMFASQKADRCDPAFQTAGDAAFDHLLGLVNTVAGRDADAHPDTMIDALATWSLIHGIASLLNNGFLLALGGGKAERDAAITAMITRYWRAQPAV